MTKRARAGGSRTTPRKRPGHSTGRRLFNGETLDIATASQLLGWTEKTLWARKARGTVPYRMLDGRVVFLRDELIEFLRGLPGVTVEQAIANVKSRRGDLS